MQDDICFLTIAEAGRRLKSRELSPVDLTLASQAHRRARSPARQLSARSPTWRWRRRRRRNAKSWPESWRGPMHGIPYGLKDIIETEGIRTTAHSKILADHVPKSDATVVRKLKEAGAVLLGKARLLRICQWRSLLRPALAAGAQPVGHEDASRRIEQRLGCRGCRRIGDGAIGSDTAGSIRGPASLCGLAGLKPTYGRVSRRGVMVHSFSLDHVGPMTWTVEDCALMLGAIAGEDLRDRAAPTAHWPRPHAWNSSYSGSA